MKIFFTFILLVFTYTVGFSQSIFSKHKEPVSKLDKENNALQFKAWVDKNTYKKNDTITLVIEANRIFKIGVNIEIPNTEDAGKVISNQVINGKTWSYYLLKFKILKRNTTIKIPKLNIIIDEKKYNTEKITVTILK